MEEISNKIQFNNLQNCLQNLLNCSTISKIESNLLNNLINLKYDPKFEEEWKATAELILKVIAKHDKNTVISSDLSSAFFIVISSKWTLVPEMFLKNELESIFVECSSANLSLFIGMLKFIVAQKYQFSDINFYTDIDSKILSEIRQLLPKLDYVNILLYMTDVWLTFLLEQNCIKKKDNCDILVHIMSVITAYWNHKLVQRLKVEHLLMKVLKFDHLNSERGNAAYMSIFKYLENTCWKVPFKYFICVNWLKFVIDIYPISEVFHTIKEDLIKGFQKSLNNKNVVGIEAELFNYCLNNFTYNYWETIFISLTALALQKRFSAAYYVKWWLPLVLKRFPQFVEIIYPKLSEINDPVIYSRVFIAILKCCRLWKISYSVFTNEKELLSHLNQQFAIPEELRCELFSLICDLRDQSVPHSKEELEIIFSFLKYNVNSNCTMLRQCIFSSFSKFVLRLICSTVRVIKKGDEDCEFYVLEFLKNFNNFLLDGIKPGCSYQRTVTCLNLYKILMSYTVRSCRRSLHWNNLIDADKFVEYARHRNMWNFNSDENRKRLFGCLINFCEEIQDLASVLLISYFNMDRIELRVFVDALSMSKDNQFYKRNCGVSAVITLISMAYNTYEKPCEELNMRISSFVEFFLDELENAVEILRKDILDSAVNHPLDRHIRILMFLISNKNSPEFDVVSSGQVERLISSLEVIVPLLLKALFMDKFSDYAPSFEESDLALHMIIKNSALKDTIALNDEQNECQLQPVNQLLLNFIWITLKVCCELEGSLIINKMEQMDQNQVIRCCDLVIDKLKYCRHKGVIEAAGVSLSNIVKILTTEGICETWLDAVLTDIIYLIEFVNGASISRKSAGLSLLIQSIVASDQRPNKPLLFKCWLEFRRILNVDYSQVNANVSHEIPQTHALHFLRVLVNDARNNANLSEHLEDITILSLTTLTSSMWLIRNAALQLFSALLPKIVGQRNPVFEIGVKCCFEEVFLLMPKILDHIICSLELIVNSSEIMQNADVAPILSVLMNLKITDSSLMSPVLYQKLSKLRMLVHLMLQNCNYTIREMASKVFVALFNPLEIVPVVEKMSSEVVSYMTSFQCLGGENHLHGCLLVLKHVYDFKPDGKRAIPKHVISIEQSAKVSLVSQGLLLDMEITNVSLPFVELFQHLSYTLKIIEAERHIGIGYDRWLRAFLKVLLKNHNHVIVIRHILDHSDSLVLKTCLEELTRNYAKVDALLFVTLLRYLNHYLKSSDVSALNSIMQTFVKLYDYENLEIESEFVENFFQTLTELNYYHFQGSNIYFLSVLAMNTKWRISDTMQAIHEALDITKFNKTIRLNAARSVLNLSKITNEKMDQSMWNILIDMLQDEEAEIRFIGSKCVCEIFHLEMDYGPEATMNLLFDLDFVVSRIPVAEFVQVLWNKLKIIDFVTRPHEEGLNPFDRGVVNCYEEEIQIVSLAGKALKFALEKYSEVCREFFSSDYLKEYFNEYLNEAKSIYSSQGNEYLVSADDYAIQMKCYFVILVFEFLSGEVAETCDVDGCVEGIEKL